MFDSPESQPAIALSRRGSISMRNGALSTNIVGLTPQPGDKARYRIDRE